MDIIFRLEEATVSDVLAMIPDPPSYSSVRSLMRILVDKGMLRHEGRGRSYVYSPTVNRKQASQSALRHVMKTFFDNSIEQVVVGLLEASRSGMSEDELGRLRDLIEKAQKEEE